ncbi:MAG: hypothetical protein KatS3mg102_2805 [Planctomycetota bacterium]|nr:MAG: hypothetical protein KatS3mg102_2805 [Planctomycetota bacterium]
MKRAYRDVRHWSAAAWVAAVLVVLGAVHATGQVGDPEAAVGEAVAAMESAGEDGVFAAVGRLERLGATGVEAARRALQHAGPRARVGLAAYLLQHDEGERAFAVLREAATGEDPLAARLAAELLRQHADGPEDVAGLEPALAGVRDPFVKIALAQLLRSKAGSLAAEQLLKDYLAASELDVRAAAALALAELGNIEAARPVLRELAASPTLRGRYAQNLLQLDKLYRSLERTQGLEAEQQVKLLEQKNRELEQRIRELERRASAPGGSEGGVDLSLLQELLRHVRLYYVEDGDKTDPKRLIDHAAKGLVSSLDPFSSYMTEKETEEFERTMQGQYAGIGAVVSMDPKDKLLTIIRPIYSGPAYRAGLRSLDKITEVEGESTFGKTVEELVAKLKGPAGTPVTIKVYRKSWEKERTFTLIREEIQLDSVHFAMLPGGIGYLALSQFGHTAVDEVEKALVELEHQGMRGLILDLRANPGGLLSAAVDIADKFLKDDKLIVYSEGRNPHIAPRREFRTRQASTHPDYPIVVLVNRASASASEIVAGALQDHKRALLVGSRTFGKGSVQQLIKVRATGGQSTLRLTIAKYYLPSGRSIHRDSESGEGGVVPDVLIEPEEEDPCTAAEIERVLGNPALERYGAKLWAEHEELMAQLAEFDGLDPQRYPGFEEFYAALQTTLDRQAVRRLVRGVIRRYAQDRRAKEFAHDYENDVQLQRAIYEMAKKLGTDLAQYPEYAFFAHKFAARPEAPAELR